MNSQEEIHLEGPIDPFSYHPEPSHMVSIMEYPSGVAEVSALIGEGHSGYSLSYHCCLLCLASNLDIRYIIS